MSKLYPPVLAGTIPAFYGNIMKVPFQMNRAVSNKEVKGFYLKIKTVQNSRLIGIVYASENNIDYNTMTVNFEWDFVNHLNIGQHYKIQIAYVGSDEIVGHYSTVGVIKYTSKPKVEIQDLVKEKDNVHRYSYLGVYAQQRPEDNPNQKIDSAEKLYSYCFNLYDVAGNLIHTSGWQIHNSIQDTEPNMAICSYVLNKELDENQKYYIEFEIITNNKLHEQSGKYSLIQKKSISPNVDFELIADSEQEIENGGIVVGIHDKNLQGQKNQILRTGSFKLMRADEESNYTEWSEILAFKLFNQEAPSELFIDYTVKQGIKYKYAIVQYNNYSLQSNKIESKPVSSDFDYTYLFDGKRQLKIKYNPKVSSFKEVLLESKSETIGGKHPFIFRNGNVEYKEFPISGLITTLMDDNYLFFPNRPKELNKDRKYEYLYKEIPVVKDKVYYYQEDWEILFCKKRQYSDNYYLSIRDYCNNEGKLITEGYNSDLDYALRSLNSNYDSKDPNSKKYLYTKVVVENTKTYWYPEIKNELYVLFEDKYKKVENDAEYDKSFKYFILKVRTKNNSNFSNSYFINDYNEESIQNERDFKLEVLDWLNNGKTKLFRSPTEGNYIVRLMNSSLTPNEQLGRVLHTFNSTAYEVAEYNFDNLLENNFIIAEDPTIKTIRWETVLLDKPGIGSENNLLKYKAVALRFEGMIAGDKVYIDDGIIRPTGVYIDGAPEMKSGFSLVIGATGSYNLDLTDNVVISQVKFEGSVDNIETDEKKVQHQGTLTYAYESAAFTSFDTIETFKVEITPLQQFFGKYNNIIAEINNIKNQLQEIYFIHAVLREQIDIYEQKYIDENEEEIIYYTSSPYGGNTIVLNNDRNCFYKVYENIEGEFIPTKFYDGYHFKFLSYSEEEDENSDILIFNNEKEGIKLFYDNDFFLKNPENIHTIKTGHRVLLEICYQSTITSYGAEQEIAYVKDSYNHYITTKNEYLNRLSKSKEEFTLEETYRAEEAMNLAYKDYIYTLELELERQGGIEGEPVE